MINVPKQLKAALAFSHSLPEEIASQGYSVVKGLTGNVDLSNPPVDIHALALRLDTYSGLIIDARDGSRKAIAARDQEGQQVIRMVRHLASYVENNCKDDVKVFLSSGFNLRSAVRKPAQPLDQPIILGIEQGNTGQLLVSIKAVARAKTYELRYGANGSAPASWEKVTVSGTKAPAPINGLVVGTTYAVQVRAYAKVGYTDWSDSATRMCI